jgi:hypothetical protein
MLLALILTASAADSPGLLIKEGLGASFYPTGVISNTTVYAQTPLTRNDSMVFQDTSAGAGVRFAASPAFVEVGPSISIAPIDVFDIGFEATAVQYIKAFGPLPYTSTTDKKESQRNARSDESFAPNGWSVTATPTVKIKVGPIIAFDAWTITKLHINQPDGVDSPYVYEPLRDMVVAWDDIYLEHQAAVLYEASVEPMLWTGVTYRAKNMLESGDKHKGVGPMIVFDPSDAPAVPTIVGLALFHLDDPDRDVASAPYMGVMARWSIDKPFSGTP